MKSQEITKVSKIYHLGKCQGNPTNICGDMSVWTSEVDLPSNTTNHRDRALSWLKNTAGMMDLLQKCYNTIHLKLNLSVNHANEVLAKTLPITTQLIISVC